MREPTCCVICSLGLEVLFLLQTVKKTSLLVSLFVQFLVLFVVLVVLLWLSFEFLASFFSLGGGWGIASWCFEPSQPQSITSGLLEGMFFQTDREIIISNQGIFEMPTSLDFLRL